MACFYCARRKVTSQDAGNCEKCKKPVCVDGLCARKGRYHAATCGCGCGDLVCRYDMNEHVARKHKGSMFHCFAESALVLGLTTAVALESLLGAKSNSRRTGPAVEDIREFLEVFKLRQYAEAAGATVVPESQGPAPQPGLYYVGHLANLVPAVVDCIKQSWVNLPSPRRAQFTGPLGERLEALAHDDIDFVAAPLDRRTLAAYRLLSPRLHMLMRDYAQSRFVDLAPNAAGWAQIELQEAERAAGRLQRAGRGFHLAYLDPQSSQTGAPGQYIQK